MLLADGTFANLQITTREHRLADEPRHPRSTLTSPGLTKSGTVQPSRSYSAAHDCANAFHRSASPDAERTE